MATLIKEHEGIIYEEYFHENPGIFTLTPSESDCIEFTRDGLHIKHNNNYVNYMIKEPSDPYCMIVRITHRPVTKEDIAGILLLSTNDDYAECQSYLAESPSTIGNNGENATMPYDLSQLYTEYHFDFDDSELKPTNDEEWDQQHIINPDNDFVDTLYQYIKVNKYNDKYGNTYQFYASADGFNWIEVGNAHYTTGNDIGFFLYGTEDENTLNKGNFLVHSMIIYENQFISIRGISIFQAFELFAEDKGEERTIFRSDTRLGKSLVNHKGNRIEINTTEILTPLKNARIRIFPIGKYNVTTAEYSLGNITLGGDIFSINYDIQLYIDNELIKSGETYDVGTLFTSSFKRNVVIYNNEDFDLANLKVSIVAFSEYYSGEEVIKIALYKGSEMDVKPDSYEYTESILIPKLEAHSGTELVMRLSDIPKQSFYSVTNKYRFRLLIE